MEKKILIFMVVFFVITCHVFADKYKVLYVNSTGIKIEKKNVVVGSIFSDKDIIEWTNNQQAMKVINLSTNRIMVLAAKAMKKKKSYSLYEYLTSTKHLSTRQITKKRVLEEWQLDSTLYLLDTLYIRSPHKKEKSVLTKIVIKESGERVIQQYNESQYFIITRNIFENRIPHQINVDIKEYDKEYNWEYIVFRNLIIEPLPIKTE